MKIKKLSYQEYISIYNKVPRLCVDLVIKKRDKILLVKRNVEPRKGLWHLPGGTILRGESIFDAAQRIGQEEAELKVKNIELLGVLEFSEEDNDFFHVISLLHLVTEYEDSGSFLKESAGMEFFREFPQMMIEEQASILMKYGLPS